MTPFAIRSHKLLNLSELSARWAMAVVYQKSITWKSPTNASPWSKKCKRADKSWQIIKRPKKSQPVTVETKVTTLNLSPELSFQRIKVDLQEHLTWKVTLKDLKKELRRVQKENLGLRKSFRKEKRRKPQKQDPKRTVWRPYEAVAVWSQ